MPSLKSIDNGKTVMYNANNKNGNTVKKGVN